jgi:hypothetical protein
MWIYRGLDLKFMPDDYVLRSGERLASEVIKPKRSKRKSAKADQ